MTIFSILRHHLSFKGKAFSAGQLRAIVLGLVLTTLFTLLMYTAPTELLVSAAANTFRYEVLESSAIAEEEEEGEEEKCLAHHHVLFLKTHKCASSTVQNIFLRFGYNNNLTFALPDGGNYLGNPAFFQNCLWRKARHVEQHPWRKAKMISKSLLPEDGKVDLFAVHTRLNFPEHSRVLHNDTKWVTIVRNPETHYESIYNFFDLKNSYGLELSQYSTQDMEMLMSLPRYLEKFGRNQMLFDLGYPEKMTVTELRSAIDDLDGIFDLVMVSELMDESLILLRRLLCWSLHDVVVFTKNARREEVKPTLESHTLQAIRELNSADVLLYDHFLARHHQAVSEFGAKRMADEVLALQSLRDKYYENCVADEVKGKDSSLKYKEYSGLVSAYVTANNSDQNCVMLSMPELPLLESVRQRQRRMLESKRTS